MKKTERAYHDDGSDQLCSSLCVGMVTEPQIDDIHLKCEKKSRESFVKSGGNAEAFEAAKHLDAVEAVQEESASCFDKVS